MSPAFSKLDHGDIVPIGYQVVNCPMIFDVRMEYFRHKQRLVAGGNVIEPPATITYSMVLSWETVSIALALSDLNDFPV